MGSQHGSNIVNIDPTCNSTWGQDGFCKWFCGGTNSVYGSYVGLTRTIYSKMDQGNLLVLQGSHAGMDTGWLVFKCTLQTYKVLLQGTS